MTRLNSVEVAEADGKAKLLLEGVERSLGGVPNFMKVFANSPATLEAFVSMNGSLARGKLDAKTRERIALSMAESNSCQYCVSAHTALAEKAGLDNGEIDAARRGSSTDAKADAALTFAQSILDNRGDVTTGEFEALREAGFSDGEIVEIIGNVALNILTNYFAKAAQVDIDFPEVELLNKVA